MTDSRRKIYAVVGGVRRFVAHAGQEIPPEYAHLIASDDTTTQSTDEATEATEPVVAHDTASDEDVSDDYSGLKQPELKALLDERGIEYPSGPVKNAALVELLETADE